MSLPRVLFCIAAIAALAACSPPAYQPYNPNALPLFGSWGYAEIPVGPDVF
jgi:hypothetical protein